MNTPRKITKITNPCRNLTTAATTAALAIAALTSSAAHASEVDWGLAASAFAAGAEQAGDVYDDEAATALPIGALVNGRAFQMCIVAA